MPAAQREAVRALMTTFTLSERWACGLVGIGRSTCRYQSKRNPATGCASGYARWPISADGWGIDG